MHFKINKISTLNQKMKTSKTLSLSWQNKLISTALAAVSLLLGSPQLATANVPSVAGNNATVVAGGVTFPSPTTSTLTVNQTTPTAVVSWGAFSDGSTPGGLLATGDVVTYQFPTTGGAILNNVTGISPTILDGSIRATNGGSVFFLNPNGIVVSSTAQINVGGFYASTVPDTSAISYFYQNGTLGVFNNVTQASPASGASGVIYIESGASISTNNPSIGVNLATSYVGSGVTVGTTASATGSNTTYLGTVSGNAGLANAGLITPGVLTLNQGIASGTGVLKGITVDSISISGSLNVISLGMGSGVNIASSTGNTAVLQSGYTSTGALAGGNLSIVANNGPVVIGPISVGGNVNINNAGSGGASLGTVNLTSSDTISGSLTITANGNVTTASTLTASNITIDNSAAAAAYVSLGDTATGKATILTNNGNIYNSASGSGFTSSSSLSSFNAGSKGNITLNGSIAGATSITGNQIVITDVSTSAVTFSTITANGNTGLAPANVNISNVGGVTLTSVNANGGLTLTSTKGAATVGSSSTTAALSSIYGNVVISGNTGASLYTTNVYYQSAYTSANNQGAVYISTKNTVETGSNYIGAAVGNVLVQSVTLNGNISATANNKGSVTLSGVTELTSSGQFSTINAYTNAGSITLSGVTTNNGNIAVNNAALYTNTTDVTGYSTTISNVGNYTSNYLTVPSTLTGGDTYYTGNGSVTIGGLTTINTAVSITDTIGSISSSSVLSSITGPNLLTENGASVYGTQPSYALKVVANNGAIDLGTNGGVNFGTLPAIATAGGLSKSLLVASTTNSGITLNSGSDINVNIDISAQGNTGALTTSNTLATTAISFTSTTGNVTLGNVDSTTLLSASSLIVPKITISANKGVSLPAIDSTSFASSLISITTANTLNVTNLNNTVGTVQLGASKAPATLKLTSTTGNVNIDAQPANNSQDLTATSLTGNVNVTAAITGNNITLIAGSGIVESGSGSITVLNNKTLNAQSPYVSIALSNSIPNLLSTLGTTSVTVNSGGPLQTLNIVNGTNVPGNLTVTTTSQDISIGKAASDTITIGGTATFDTSAGTGQIATLANNLNVFGNVTLRTNGQNASLGSAASASSFGQITATTTATTSGIVTINESNITNLGVITANTLIVNAPSILNTSGVVTATTANLSAGNSSTPGSITIGQGTIANPAVITNVNVLNAAVLSYNGNSTIVADNNNITSLVLNATGAQTYKQTGGSVGSVSATDTAGLFTYTMVNAPTTSGSIASNGGMNVTSRGTGSLGSVTFNIGTSSASSTISNNTSWTASNISSSSTSTGALTITQNTGSTSTGTATLTLGSGINLLGSGAVIFNSGNTNGSYGTVIDSSAPITINTSASPVVFIGKTISITNVANTLPAISISTNGSYTITNNSNIVLGAITLGNLASNVSTIQSVTGNITQNGSPTILSLSPSAPLSFLASSTGNNGVYLNGATNNFYASSGSPVSISASGNSAIISNNNTGLFLGASSVIPSANASSVSSQLSVSVPAGTNVGQTGALYIWGNTSIISGTAAGSGTGNIALTNGGNNFGQLSLGTGSGTIQLTETATSAYNTVKTSGNFTGISSTGDIATASNNSAFALTGNSNFQAPLGNISLTNVNNVLNSSGGTTTVSSGQSTTLVSNQSQLLLGTGSQVNGNLSVTNSYVGGFIQDQASTSGITVLGSTSLVETGTNGSIYLTGSNNNLSGGVITQAAITNIQNKGNLVILPGNRDTTAYFTSITGNVSTSGTGGSNFTTLTLSAPYGNITISNPLRVTSQLYLNAPLGIANVSFLSLNADLGGTAPSPSQSGTTVQTYIPPSP